VTVADGGKAVAEALGYVAELDPNATTIRRWRVGVKDREEGLALAGLIRDECGETCCYDSVRAQEVAS